LYPWHIWKGLYTWPELGLILAIKYGAEPGRLQNICVSNLLINMVGDLNLTSANKIFPTAVFFWPKDETQNEENILFKE
jgi:hypothetical protein